MQVRELQQQVEEVFTQHFGRTSLRRRLDDILQESIELSRYRDLRHMKEEAGDTLASLLMLLNENEWSAEEVVAATLNKIKRRRHQYASLGRKIKVALLGGSFDPIHVGHMETARAILNTSREFDEVWLMPAYGHLQKVLTPPEHRLAMLELATAAHPQLKAFDYEIRHQLRGETLHLVTRLCEEDFAKDHYDISFAIGQDVANSLPEWPNADLLRNDARFVVVSREGYELDPSDMWYVTPPHRYLRIDDGHDVSSTRVRRAAAEGDPALDDLVPEGVAAYIREHGLYGAGPA